MTAPTPPAVESRGLTKQSGNKHYCPAAVLALCILSLLASASTLAARTLSIRNNTLIASYNDVSNTFLLTERSSARVFLKEGKLHGAAGKAQVESVKDPVFKSGKRIVVPRAGGGSVSLELYRDLPFLLVRGELRNDSPAVAEVTSLSPASFELDLGTVGAANCAPWERLVSRRPTRIPAAISSSPWPIRPRAVASWPVG